MDPAGPERTGALRDEEGEARFRVTVPRPTQGTSWVLSLNVMTPAVHHPAIVRKANSTDSEFRTYSHLRAVSLSQFTCKDA